MSIADFFNAGVNQPWLFLAAILTLAVVFVNGWSDAPNAIATAVSTRSIDARKAVIMAAIFNCLGVIAMGFLSKVLATGVASTVANIVALPKDASGALMPQEALIMISVAMLSILIFSTIATLIGFPSSESNELLGGLTGASIAYVAMSGGSNWFSGINWMEWLTTVIGIFASLIIGFILGWVFVKIIELICQKMKRSKTTKFFDIAQDFSAGAMAFMHGVQDGLKFIGVFLMIVAVANGKTEVVTTDIPTWVILMVAAVMLIGTCFGGYKVIKKVGVGMAKLEKYQGFATDLAGSVGLLIATFAGWPVSTGQVKMSAILGSGASKGIRRVRWDVAGEMILTWLITLPVAVLLGGGLTALLLAIFK
ncbi:MAG: Low-affinity inorganic phosphate transporter 1 [Tenericutes bacterium ADurb.BinA155]|nr:MAG: Low-affinity inorganic phosphate transporter 1 [Tenericutes bacterium ADurb.BinA155]